MPSYDPLGSIDEEWSSPCGDRRAGRERERRTLAAGVLPRRPRSQDNRTLGRPVVGMHGIPALGHASRTGLHEAMNRRKRNGKKKIMLESNSRLVKDRGGEKQRIFLEDGDALPDAVEARTKDGHPNDEMK